MFVTDLFYISWCGLSYIAVMFIIDLCHIRVLGLCLSYIAVMFVSDPCHFRWGGEWGGGSGGAMVLGKTSSVGASY